MVLVLLFFADHKCCISFWGQDIFLMHEEIDKVLKWVQKSYIKNFLFGSVHYILYATETDTYSNYSIWTD